MLGTQGASAASITVESSANLDNGSGRLGFFEGFDTSLGTLTSVVVGVIGQWTFDATMTGTGSPQDTFPPTGVFAASAMGNITADINGEAFLTNSAIILSDTCITTQLVPVCTLSAVTIITGGIGTITEDLSRFEDKSFNVGLQASVEEMVLLGQVTDRRFSIDTPRTTVAVTFNFDPVAPVPVPASALMLAGALAGLLMLRRRRTV